MGVVTPADKHNYSDYETNFKISALFKSSLNLFTRSQVTVFEDIINIAEIQ